MTRTIAIVGSAREESNTLATLRELSPFVDYQLFELHKCNIDHYSYDSANTESRDDFLTIVEAILQADDIIFATPVYWYAMSGRMKVFFDRLTELITTRKQLGRALKGKRCHLIACGTDAELPFGFAEPFRRTSEYFGMEFSHTFYKQIER